MGWTDEGWMDSVTSSLHRRDYRSLARRVSRVTGQRMAAAGDISGELLCWITATGALGSAKPQLPGNSKRRRVRRWKVGVTSMSIYSLNKMFYTLENNADFRQRMLADPI